MYMYVYVYVCICALAPTAVSAGTDAACLAVLLCYLHCVRRLCSSPKLALSFEWAAAAAAMAVASASASAGDSEGNSGFGLLQMANTSMPSRHSSIPPFRSLSDVACCIAHSLFHLCLPLLPAVCRLLICVYARLFALSLTLIYRVVCAGARSTSPVFPMHSTSWLQ